MSEEQILACEARLREAMFANDVAALDQLLDDRLIFTALDGSVVGKQDDLAAHRARRLRLSKMEPIEQQILHLGETAVVNVLMDHAGTWDGMPVSGKLRYTRVWHRSAGSWKIIAGHLSGLTQD